MKNLLSKSKLALFALVLLTVFSCGKDDDATPNPTPDGLIASFQSEVSATNPFEVAFTNFSSDDATGFSWDFGDGETSTEESPTHIYSEGGSFTVVLTATDGTDSKTKEETITITDPNAATSLLTGTGSKTWYLQREGIALGVGEFINANNYWSFGGVSPLSGRPCILDDQYTFNSDGTFEFNSNGTFWKDLVANGGWEIDGADGEDCYDETEPNVWGDADRSAFGSGGAYTYNYDPSAGTITIDGLGAYIGLCNKTADGDNDIPISSKSYRIFNFVDGDVADSLQMAIEQADGAFWNFYLVSYDNPADLPDIPTGSGPPTGNDLPDETPTQLFNTFASDGAADVQELVPTESAVTITPGVTDPAGGATGVGEYIRGTAEAYSDLKFALAYDAQLTNFTEVTIDVYFPSSNNYSGALSQQVDIFIADASEDTQFWTTWELFVNDTQTTMDQWVTITFPLGNALTRDDLDMIGLKIGGENHNEDGTFYIRNFTFQ